jgi:hypothetical protein
MAVVYINKIQLYTTMAVKKRICYKYRLKTHDPATIKCLIEGRMNVEKYLERKRGQVRSRWEVVT